MLNNYMKYNLFLDDVRQPHQVTWLDLPLVEWKIVRSFDQFITYIKLHGVPQTVAFDHDLDPKHYTQSDAFWSNDPDAHIGEPTGMDCVKWLVEFCHEHNHAFPTYYLHTLNDAGKKNMDSYIYSALKSENIHQ